MEVNSLSKAFMQSFLEVLKEPSRSLRILETYSESHIWTELILGCTELGRTNQESLLNDVLN